eukprot:2839205-Rhodomonas_salina.2
MGLRDERVSWYHCTHVLTRILERIHAHFCADTPGRILILTRVFGPHRNSLRVSRVLRRAYGGTRRSYG